MSDILDLLNPYKWLIGIALVAALSGGAWYAKGVYDDNRRAEGAAPYIAAIAAQKAEAATQLAAKIAENAAREKADALRAITNQKDYDDALKKLAADRDKYRADGLRFKADRGGICGDSTGKEAGASAGATQDVPVEVRIPYETGKALRELADEADRLAVWGRSCFQFVNK